MSKELYQGKVTFTEVDYDDVKQQWRVTCQWEAGHKTLYVFPHDTMEWRAAEYGIDPSDTATLLDIVMAEPFMTPEDWAEGCHLYGANGTHPQNIEEARRHHVSRAAKIKLRHRISTRGAQHVCNRIAQQSTMDKEAVELKKEIVTSSIRRIKIEAAMRKEHRLHRLRAMVSHGRNEQRERTFRGNLDD